MKMETNKNLKNTKNIDYSQYKYQFDTSIGFTSVPNPFNNLQYPTQLSIRVDAIFRAVESEEMRLLQKQVKNLIYNLTPKLKSVIDEEYNRLILECSEEERKLQCVRNKADTPSAEEVCSMKILDLHQDYARKIAHLVLGLLDNRGLLLQPERQIERGGI